MGTHGRRGPKRWWLGSVAERVLREIPRPLLVVRADTPGPVDAVFSRVLVHAATPLVGDGALDYARHLTARFTGEVVDVRGQAIEPAVAAARATLLVVAAPLPRTSGWLSHYADSLVRFCTVPILFVPETNQGASS
jgi:hypothetical protein